MAQAKKTPKTKQRPSAGSRSGKVRSRKLVRPPKERHSRPKGRLAPLYGAVSGLVMLAAVTAGILVFFRVDTVVVNGNQRYTQEQVVAASGIQTGDSLFLMNKFLLQEDMTQELPYLGEVDIQRHLPGTIEISVEEKAAVAAIRISNGYWYIDETGKLLEMKEGNEGLIEVTGISLVSPVGGEEVEVNASHKLKKSALTGLLSALCDAGLLENAQSINLTESSGLVMQYTDQYQVKIPYGSDFDYKVRALAGIVTAQEEDNDARSGVIDLTLEDEWHFIPD